MFRLARFSLANRALIALITLVIAGFGLLSMTQLKQELIPDIEFPQSQVITVLPGVSPQIIDEQVSVPIANAIRDLPDIEAVTSASSSSLSLTTVAYRYGADAAELKASLTDALNSISSVLPTGAEPEIMTGSSSMIPIMFLTAADDSGDSAALSQTVSAHIVPTLEALDGVRGVTASGLDTQRISIALQPQAQELGISAVTISEALQQNGMTLPMGSVQDDGLVLPVQGGTPLTDLQDLEQIPLPVSQGPGQMAAADPATEPASGNAVSPEEAKPSIVTLGNVADVTLETEVSTSITRANGSEAVSLMVLATQGADVVATSHEVQDALAQLKAELPSVELTVLFDQGPFVSESIEHLTIEGGLGILFAVIVILVFLFSVRSTLVTAVSIPLSILVTFVGLQLGGHSLNMLTLGALTIAIGRIVDDSIVVIENIKRHLAYGEPKREAILTAVREVASAITSSTLTTVAVFIPIAVVGGLVGELFTPFALTVTIAMLSSLVVALTVVPVLSYWFLPTPSGTESVAQVRAAAEAKEHRSWLQRSYKPVLQKTQKHPVITLVSSVLLLVITFALTPLLKVDFLGSTGQNALFITQSFPAGTDLATISKGASQVEEALEDVPGVEDMMLTAGSGDGALAMLANSSEATFIVNTDKDADQKEIEAHVRAALETVTVGEVAIDDGAAMGGFGGSVDVIVTVLDEGALRQAAESAYDALKSAPETTEVALDLASDQTTVQVEVDRMAAVSHGLTEMQVLGMVANTLLPQAVGSITMDSKQLDIYLDAGEVPATMDELAQLPLPTPSGMITLDTVAEVAKKQVPVSIARQEGELVATISLTPAEGELGTVSTWVTEQLPQLELPDGAAAKLGGLAEQQSESFGQLGIAMLVAIALVFILLVATFRSLIQPLILLVSIPFAATGAIALLLLSGRAMGISALIGLLMLIGIVVTNAIVLIDLINQYRDQGQSVSDAVFNGARQRLRPILMTALATIFALLPMAFGITGSSGFISQDLAIVVIGGLVSSTALTLILVPVLYRLIEGKNKRRELREPARSTAEVEQPQT